MYIKAIRCINHGPISDLSLEATFSPESGAPDPIILVGPNGSGKSLILSSILDCMVELKRRAYHEAPEVIVDEMLRMQSRDYISPNSSFSYVHIVVTHAEREATYTDFVSNITGPSLIEYINQNPLPALNLSNPLWTSDGFFKDVASDTQFLDDFRSSLYLYFPFFRYEHPAWLNPQAPIEFALRSPLHKISTESLIQTNVSAAIEAWILDLVLDRAVYEMRTTHVPNQPYPYFIEYSGRNSTLLKLVNDLLTTLYKTKDNNIDTARFGVHPKQRRHISINVQRRGEENATQIAATFSHLSSGEQAILGIFFSILRAFDGLGIPLPARLDDVAGVVLIDEADLHLHVDFQNKVLPALLKRFPKIQWIISTHSPLLILGLNEQYDGKIKLVDLPGGQQILPSEFSEFQRAYEIFVDRSEQFKAAHDAIFDQIRSLQKPLVITEGKTDWKHLKAALAWLQTRGEFSDLDVQFHEYDSDLGDDQLEQICRNIAFMGSEKIIICMFDRDNKKIVPKVTAHPGEVRLG